MSSRAQHLIVRCAVQPSRTRNPLHRASQQPSSLRTHALAAAGEHSSLSRHARPHHPPHRVPTEPQAQQSPSCSLHASPSPCRSLDVVACRSLASPHSLSRELASSRASAPRPCPPLPSRRELAPESSSYWSHMSRNRHTACITVAPSSSLPRRGCAALVVAEVSHLSPSTSIYSLTTPAHSPIVAWLSCLRVSSHSLFACHPHDVHAC
jgi:hypothetical protein